MTDPLLELNEVDENKLYKNGMIIKSGNFCISGNGLFYGIHIPTNSRDEAEKIINQIKSQEQQIKQLKEKTQQLIDYADQLRHSNFIISSEIKRILGVKDVSG
jgi:uncharacterized lipoprotein YehR (DUF1307 family)